MLCMLLFQPLPNNKNSDFFFEKSNFGQDFFAFLALCFAFDKKRNEKKFFKITTLHILRHIWLQFVSKYVAYYDYIYRKTAKCL